MSTESAGRQDAAFAEVLSRPEVKAAELKVLFEDAPIGIAFVAADGTFMRVNAAYCALVGWTSAELVGVRKFQDITHPADVAADVEEAGRVARGEQRGYKMAKRYIHKLGRSVWVNLTVDRVDSAGGVFAHFIAHADAVAMADDFYRIEQNRDGSYGFRPYYPIERLVKDNWKKLIALATVALSGVGAAVHRYYLMQAQLEVLHQKLDENKQTIDKLEGRVKALPHPNP